MSRKPRVPWRNSLRYELAVWRGLFRCLRAGHHTMTCITSQKWYCWSCFHRYPYTEKPFLWRIRNLLGYLASSDLYYWR